MIGADTVGSDGFPLLTQFMAYVREAVVNGVQVWTLYDCDGREVFASDNRSSVFYYAHDRECRVVMRH